MKIGSITVRNKFIDFTNISLDFSLNGVYLLQGKNGSGKTTLLEEIVFGKYNAEFDDAKMYELHQQNRFELFTYISQNIVVTKLSIADYIIKGNSHVKLDEIKVLLDEFEMSDIDLGKPFNVLSGGEKIKLSIICGLLKDTPYIFMDEPTNNLDNSSVELLTGIINRLSTHKSFIIISHDNRFNIEPVGIYVLANNKIVEKEINHICTPDESLNQIQADEKSLQSRNKPNYLSIMIAITTNMTHYVSVALMAIVLTTMAMFAHFEISRNYSDDIVPPSDMIAVYSVDRGYGELNKKYVEGERLSIDESKKYDLINYEIMDEVAAIDGVKDIYLIDYKYISEIEKTIQLGTAINKIQLISFPQAVYQNFLNIIDYSFGIGFVQGRLPKDNANEVTISKGLLKTHYGYSDASVEGAIGDKIAIDGSLYAIVGFYYYDVAVVSFDSAQNYGFYSYSEDTYVEFAKRLVQYFIDEEYLNVLLTEQLFITTDTGREREVLNNLSVQSPGNNFFSSHYTIVWSRVYNQALISRVLILNIIICLVLATVLFLINRNSIKGNYNIIKDFENYYINRKSIRWAYRIFTIVQYVFVMMLVLVLNTVFSAYSFSSNFILLINSIIIILPLLISQFVGTKNASE